MSGESQRWILIAAFRDGAADQKISPTGAACTWRGGVWAECRQCPVMPNPAALGE